MKHYLTLEETKAIGPRIKKLLKEKGISAGEAANELQIEKSHYYKLLKGTRSLTVDNLIAHCLFLDVSIGYLLFGDESLIWDPNERIVPGEIEIMMDKLITSIGKLEHHHKAEKTAKLVHRIAVMIEEMDL